MDVETFLLQTHASAVLPNPFPHACALPQQQICFGSRAWQAPAPAFISRECALQTGRGE